ncbi:MAG: methyltransferase domain-containing protein [Haloarculaceae archaeon]
MSDDATFDETKAERVEALYTTEAAAARRRRVREALAPEPDESVLSIGCGPGFEPLELADEVGEDGHVHALDVSEAMLALATDRCGDRPGVTVEQGDATDLPVADASVDAAASVQVYEYVDDVPAAAAELRRVLRPGGRAVVYATDWDSAVWNAADRERSRRVLDAWDGHCTRPHLGSQLRPVLDAAGLAVESVEPFTIVETGLDGTFAGHMQGMMGAYAATHDVGKEAARAWSDDLEAREAADETFFSLTAYLHAVRRPV